MQELARLFAAPLGLVSVNTPDGAYALEMGDEILQYPWIREVLQLTDAADGATVSLDEVYGNLRRAPFGFLRETQHLILAALIAGRRIELVTSAGDRIGRRTLGDGLKWDEMAGMARVATLSLTAQELTRWATLLTNHETHASIAEPDRARSRARESFTMLDAWRMDNPLTSFDAMPDEGLTTRVWNRQQDVRKVSASRQARLRTRRPNSSRSKKVTESRGRFQ